jgi:hypothetical protein
MPNIYAAFVHSIHGLAHNIVCASCGIREHDPALFVSMRSDDTLLQVLSVAEDTFIPYDYSCGIGFIDSRRIMIDQMGLTGDGSHISLCHHCNTEIAKGNQPIQSLANYRWIGPVPDELLDLNWLEELLIARAHLIDRIVRLEERKASSYFALKGHTVLLPQDTTRLIDLLPMSPSSLPDIVRVVWTGKSTPNKTRLRSNFTVRRDKVYRALKWLCQNHEDYRHVIIDEERISTWDSTFVVTELLDSMGTVSDPAAEDASKSGFATEDPDVDGVQGDIPFTVSGILDVNNVTQPTSSAILSQLADLK